MAIIGGKKPAKPEEPKEGKPLLPLTMQAQRDIANWNKQDEKERDEFAEGLADDKAVRDEEAGK